MPDANAKVIVHTAVNPSGGDGFCLPLVGNDDAGHIVAQIAFDADPRAMVSAVGPALPLGKWSYVLASWSSRDGLRLYVDGALVGTAPAKHRLAPASPISLFVGSDRGAACWTHRIESGDFNGAVDDLRVWDHALSEEEVRAASAE